jgi:carbohydrate esterase-like sialic acid-specific acetylesterase
VSHKSPFGTVSLLVLAAVLLAAGLPASRALADGPIHVFLFGGQSNMRGGAYNAPSELRGQEDVLYSYNVSGTSGGSTFDESGWVPLDQLPYGDLSTHWIRLTYGPELRAGVMLSDYYGSTAENPNVAFIKVARDGSRLTLGANDTWNVAQKYTDNQMLKIFHETAAAALDNLVGGQSADYQIEGMFWMQGESDSAEGQSEAAYKANLENMVADIRTTLNAPSMPFFLGELADWNPSSSSDDRLRDVQLQIADEDPDAYFVETVGLTRRDNNTNVHFDAAGLDGLGRRFADAFLSTLTPPVPGDFNRDGLVNAADVDQLFAEIAAGTHGDTYDLTDDGLVTGDDADHMIRVILGTEYGDANLDGQVSDADYTVWADHYGAPDPGWAEADFTGNGAVTEADYTIWADNYGAGVTSAALPEPSALGLIALALLARRRPCRYSA